MRGWRRAMGSGGGEDGDGADGFAPSPPDAAGDGYPYQVARLHDSDETDEVLVALAATPMTAFAAYYAAVREHLGATVVLKHNGRVIQRAGPNTPPA